MGDVTVREGLTSSPPADHSTPAVIDALTDHH